MLVLGVVYGRVRLLLGLQVPRGKCARVDERIAAAKVTFAQRRVLLSTNAGLAPLMQEIELYLRH